MQQKIEKDVLKENRWLLAGPIAFILLSVLVILLPYIEKPVEYSSLQTKTVIVKTLGRHRGSPGFSYDYIQTADGERYTVSGDYQWEQLKELLPEGTEITIKWYQNKPFWSRLAEEICVDGRTVVAYNNDVPVNKAIFWIVGIFGILLGLGSFCFIRFVLATVSRKSKKSGKSKKKRRKSKKRR